MKRFREQLRRSRLTVLSVLFAVTFSAVDGHLFSQVVAMERQEHERLEQISERLGIPIDRLRRDNPSLVETLANLVSDPDDRFRARQLERLETVLERSQAEVNANPFRERIEAVKLEHRREKLEGVLRDLAEVSSPRVERLPPAARQALVRNLRSALRDQLALPPLPEGLPSKAVARHREMENRLGRLGRDLEPLLSAPEALSEGRLSRTVADLAGAVGGAVAGPGQPPPRFRDRPLPVERVERQAPTVPAPPPADRAPTPAVVSSARASAVGEPASAVAPAAGAPAALGPIAAEITELAASLGNSPARIFTWVHDNVAYDPKWGQVRSPLGTLLERSGTSWDQAALLAELLTAAGVDARLEWGEIEIPEALLRELTGTANATDAGGVLATGGVPIVLQQIASQVVTAKLSHAWVKAHIDYIPNRGVTPGPADTWIRMDPSLKRSTYQSGIAVHRSVPYALGDYLQSATPLSPRRFREEALWAYIRANDIECTTLEQLKRAGSILQEDFAYIPGTLRGKIVSVAGEDPAVPDAFRHRLRVEVKSADGASLLAWEEPWAELWGARTEIAWVGATAADDATIASFGSIFDTPPYLVDLAPTVRVDAAEVARGSAIGSARGTEVWVTLLETSGETTTLTHDTLAGEHHVLAVDFGRLPQRLINDHQLALAAAIAAGDDFEAEAETLYLLGAQYMNNLGRDLDDLAGWNWQRLVKLGTEGLISQTGIVTTTVGGTPIGFRRGESNVDVARMILGIFPADGDHQYKTATFELVGSQSSYLEGEVFNQVVQEEGIASVSALTRSKREGQALTRVDAGNVSAVLAAVDLGPEVEDAVAFAISQGKIAWVADAPITVNQWSGTGYVLEDPATGAAGYLISGSLAGGENTGGVLDLLEVILGNEDWLEDGTLEGLVQALLGLAGGGGSGGGPPGSNKSDPINLSNGNLWSTETDLTVQARGLPITWSRTYNSRSTYNGPLGRGWTFSYGEHLTERPDGSVLYRESDGTEHIFGADGGGGYVRPAGKHITLTKSGVDFTLSLKGGLDLVFALDGKLLSMAEPNGNSVTLGYDANGDLSTVTDASGRTVITVTTSAGKITQITDLTGRTVLYSYTGDDLTTVTDTAGQNWPYAYDLGGNLLSRSDPLGNTDSYAYDSLDRCIRHTDALGNEESIAYPSIGRAAVLTDRRGFDTYFEFDERGRAVLEVDPVGNAATSTWDSDNNRVSITDRRGGLTTRTFDSDGNLLSETDPAEETTTYTYDPISHQVLTSTDASGHTVTHTYDGAGNLLTRSEQIGGATVTESYTYDPDGQVLERRDGRNNPTNFVWDATKGSLDSLSNALNQVTTVTTDTLGRLTRLEDPVTDFVTVEWDDRDRFAAVTDTFGNRTEFDYDDAGRRTTVTTPRGASTLEYDAVGRVIASTDALGNTTRTEYDAEGNVVARIDPRGNRTSFFYDAVGRVAATVDPLGRTWTLGYCAELGGNGLVSPTPEGGLLRGGCSGSTCPGAGAGTPSFCEISDPLGNTKRQDFDDLGRVTVATDQLGNVTETTYDELGRRVTVRDARNNLTRFEYDARGRVTAVVEANGARTDYSYDANGNLERIRDAEGRDWTKTYDPLDRLETETDPLGNVTTLTYDELGNLESKLTPNGDLITYDYDGRRLTAIHLPGGITESFGYDPMGRRTSMSNGEVVVSFAYDNLDRLESVINATLGQTIDYGYDANGNLISMAGPNGTVEYIFDGVNRLVEQRDPVAGTFRFSYDDLDRRTRIAYPNGASTEYSYDAASRLTSILTKAAVGSTIDGYGYTYDEVGNRTRMTQLHDATAHDYEYDVNHRLTRWDRGPSRFEEYVYDDVGNRTNLIDELGEIAYSYDPAHRITAAVRTLSGGGGSTTGYAWDANGNLLEKTLGGATTTYQWDPLDRLTQLADASGVHTYGYDPTGIRVRETNGGDTLRFLHAAEDIVGVYDATNALTAYYAHGPGVDEPLSEVTGGGAVYFHRDGLGSLTSTTDPGGSLVGGASYAAFGGVEASFGPSSRYGYTSREADPTGLLYLRARYYDPELGSFPSKDPFRGLLEMPATLLPYRYALNSPVNRTDPSGAFPAPLDIARAIICHFDDPVLKIVCRLASAGVTFLIKGAIDSARFVNPVSKGAKVATGLLTAWAWVKLIDMVFAAIDANSIAWGLVRNLPVEDQAEAAGDLGAMISLGAWVNILSFGAALLTRGEAMFIVAVYIAIVFQAAILIGVAARLGGVQQIKEKRRILGDQAESAGLPRNF